MPQKLADHIANSWRHLDRSYQLWVESLERFLFDGEKAKAKLPSDPGILRAQAVRLFAMAIQVRETEEADELIAQAVELQDQATAMEQAAKVPPNERGRLMPGRYMSPSQSKVLPADLAATGFVRDAFLPALHGQRHRSQLYWAVQFPRSALTVTEEVGQRG